jgi:GT2 family glycosyltransferase
MFLRSTVLKEVGLFDERIFMYIEDADLTRRIHLRYKTLFFPEVHVFHHYNKGSYKSFRLMMYNVHGAYVYFNTWGWFFDKQRREINKKVISAYLR